MSPIPTLRGYLGYIRITQTDSNIPHYPQTQREPLQVYTGNEDLFGYECL